MQWRHLHSDCGQDSDCARLSSRAAAAAAGLLLRPRSCRPPHRGCCESRPDSMFGGSISMEMPPGPSPSAAAKIDLLRGRAAPHPETVEEERLSWTSSSGQYPERDSTNQSRSSIPRDISGQECYHTHSETFKADKLAKLRRCEIPSSVRSFVRPPVRGQEKSGSTVQFYKPSQDHCQPIRPHIFES